MYFLLASLQETQSEYWPFNTILDTFRWPIPKSTEVISWDSNSGTVVIESEYLQLEPLGLLFILWFAVVMLFQLIGMVLHRIMTLGHIVSTTNIGISKVRLLLKVKDTSSEFCFYEIVFDAMQ